MGFLQGQTCERCNSSYGYLFFTNYGASWFCATDSCLAQDCELSKGVSKKAVEAVEFDAAHRFNLGARYVGATLAKWRADPSQMNIVNYWIKNDQSMLVLLGAPGTGKTYFCAALANYLMDQKKHVRYFNSRWFFETIQKAIGAGNNQYECVKMIADYDYLIFDDLGSSTNSEWQQEMLLELFDRRYSEKLPTIVTSNLDARSMEKALGGRTSRRVLDEGNFIITMGETRV